MSEGGDNSVVSLSEKLRQVSSQGQFDLVRELVKTGAQFNTDQEGRTALHYAALNGHVDICKFLLQQGCNIDDRDVLGYTPLHRAASKGHLEAIELLLNSKCNPNSQDEHGNGAIHEAAWNGFSLTLELLIKHRCNVILTNKSGFTALHLASQNGHNQSARVLLYGGCNADLKNNYGDTALHTAARYGHAGVTRILISARCRLNEQNKNGDTALHISSALKRRKIAKLLVEAGIDINILNKQDETAIDVARRKDHPEIILTITSLLKTKAQVHPQPKVVNFSEIPVDLEGPVVVPNEEIPTKTEKSEKGSKLFSFLKRKKKEKDKAVPNGSQVHPTHTRQTVQGFFSQYTPKTGQQYYRDLAGNIKQGPVGYTPICQCMPALQQLEKRVDKDKEHIYEHIDASHQILKHRMDQLDRRTSQQITSMDQWSRERFEEEERNCYSRIDQRLNDHQNYMAHQNHGGMDVNDWLESKLSEYGHCLEHHHDDSALPSNNIFSDVHLTENGRLFRSRSDETLSQSDNHSGRFRKKQFYESRQAAMQQIRAWQLPYGKDRDYKNPNPVTGRRDQQNALIQHNLNRNENQRSLRQNFNSPVPGQQNSRASSRPDFISPSTVSTSRSPYLSHDPIYGSQYGGYEQGAIPKKLSSSKTWHGANELQASLEREATSTNLNGMHDLRTSGNRDLKSPIYGAHDAHGAKYRESSPLNHSTPKSRESSPYQYPLQQLTMKNKTEFDSVMSKPSEIKNISNEPRNKTDSRNYQSSHMKMNMEGTHQSEHRNVNMDSRHQSEHRNMNIDDRHLYSHGRKVDQEKYKSESFERQNEVRRSHIESRTIQNENRNSDIRRSFPERGSSNTSTGTNQTSNSSNTGQGPLKESSTGKSSRPTFTTFGYSEMGQKADNSTNAEVTVVPNSNSSKSNSASNVISSSYQNSVHQEETTYGCYSNQNHNNLLHSERNSNFSTQQNRQQIQSGLRSPNYNAGNSAIISMSGKNRDDSYVSSNQNLHATRQRSRSTDGILLEDAEFSSAHEMKLKMREQKISQRSATPNSPRSTQPYSVPLETVKRSGQQYGGDRAYSQNRNDQNFESFPSERSARYFSSSQYYNSSQGNISRDVVPNITKTAPSNGYSGEQSNYNRDRPYWANDSSYRDNLYGSAQNFNSRAHENRNYISTKSNNSSSLYNVDLKGHSNLVYGDHISVQGISSKSEPHLDLPNLDNSLSPCDNDRNLQSTPIQDKSREDNSSNPDSGYSSKIFGRNINTAHGQSTSETPSSSFSTEPTDHNITLSSNNSPHPHVNHSDYAQINSSRSQYQKDLSNHVQQWYQRKLKDAAKNLNHEHYVNHNDFQSHSNTNAPNSNDHSSYEYVQPSRQTAYHGNQMYSTYQQIPSYMRGSDV